MRTGTVRCLRVVIPDDANSFLLPNTVNFFIIKNVGSNAVKINTSDDGESDYYTISANEVTPIIETVGGKEFFTDGVGGSTTIEVLAWG